MVVLKNSPVYRHPFKTRYRGKGSWSNLDSKDFSDIIISKLLVVHSLPSPLRYASRLIGFAKSLNGLKDTFSSRVNTAWKTKLLVRAPLCLQLDIVEDLTKYQRQNFQGISNLVEVWLSKMFQRLRMPLSRNYIFTSPVPTWLCMFWPTGRSATWSYLLWWSDFVSCNLHFWCWGYC